MHKHTQTHQLKTNTQPNNQTNGKQTEQHTHTTNAKTKQPNTPNTQNHTKTKNQNTQN